MQWDSEAERKLIEMWADVLREMDGKMITRMASASPPSIMS